jgi:hypothetical protein
MNQKEATFQAVINVCGEQDGAYTPTKEQRAQVNQILFEGFRAGTIELESEFSDTELKAYVSGLQSNWLRKDKRLNGNVTYVAKNPGSRQGSGDAQLKAMRALLTTVTSTEDKAEVQKHIDARTAEIAATKVKAIDLSALPESLRAKFGK